MASNTEKNRATRSDQEGRKESWWIETYGSSEVYALLFCGLAIMLLLALVSYSPSHLPSELPSWVPFGQTNVPASYDGNFVGPIGSVVAGFVYFFCGAAGFLIPVIFTCWAFQKVTTNRSLGYRNYLSLTIFVVAVACIIDNQTMFFKNWIERFDLPNSAGGYTGHRIGHEIFTRYFGPAGSFVIMTIVALVTLTLITGIHPYHFTRRFFGGIGKRLRKINWEKKWSLWSGITPKDPIYQTPRALPSVKIINVEPMVADEAEFIPETIEVVTEEEIIPEVVTEVPHHTPAAEHAKTPSPERVRKIVDASRGQLFGGASHLTKTVENQQSPFGAPQYESYQLPCLDLLSYAKNVEPEGTNDEALIQTQNHIVRTLNSFKVEVEAGDITKGPTITRYEVYPSPGLRVNKIAALKDDIARATRAERVNILAPIPGKDTVGIEIANSDKVTVALRELFESETFRNSSAKLPLVLGKDVYGKTIVGDLAKMPHLLVAGATGSGKSVCINSIIASLLYRFTPDELKFIMIDPKVVEMQLYNALPHMVVPVVTDPKNVLLALRWIIKEMENRYAMFAKKGVRNFEGYNALRNKEIKSKEAADAKRLQPNLINTETGEDIFEEDDLPTNEKSDADGSDQDTDFPERLPYIVVIIDELADLMQTSQADVETSIARIAQKARAAGIHLIIATQTPRADVITGTIKANIPSRIAFQVSSKTDSRIILDENGAENLVGKGDMLYLPPGSAQVIRAQGALITDEEAHDLVDACAAQGSPNFEAGGFEAERFGFLEDSNEIKISEADEEILSKCMEVIFTEKKASTSLLQRKLRLGYTRAARMIDILEDRGIIGPGDGAKPREVLIDLVSD